MSRSATIHARARLPWLALCALAALLGAGCSHMYVDPGPNPAHLVVRARAGVTQAQVDAAMERKAYIKSFLYFEDYSAPLWDLRAFIPRADGQLTPLLPLKPVANAGGLNLDAEAEFLAPAGDYPVVFLLECSVRHESLRGPVPSVEYVYVITWRKQLKLELCAGCRKEVEPFRDGAPRP